MRAYDDPLPVVIIATKNCSLAVWSGNDIAYVTLDFELNVDLEVKV